MSNTRASNDVTVYVGDQVSSLNVSPQFDGYSKVILNVTKELYYEAGTDTGRTLTLTCPWGTQDMCNNILDQVLGYAYQPLEATGAILDPSAELGDGVTVRDTYTMIGSTKNTFGPILRTDIITPYETEINHEFPYKSPINREVDRQYANIRSELRIQADRITAEVEERKSDIEKVNAMLEVQAGQIAAKVSKTGGSAASFGWVMDENSMVWSANNSEIFRLDRNGAKVTGEIIAKTGKIGGLEIKNNALSYNQNWGGTNTNGLYVGPNGIQLGRNFKVDSAGNLTANSGTFLGSVRAGNIQYGGSNGYFSGAGLSDRSVGGGKVGYNTISTSNTSGGINTSLGYADFSNGVFNDWQTASCVRASSIRLGGHYLGLATIYYQNAGGEISYRQVVTWE